MVAVDYAALLKEAEPELKGPRPKAWLDRLEADYDRVLATLDRAEPTDGLWMANVLHRFWLDRGHVDEGRRRLDALLSDPANANPSSTRARALHSAGMLAFRQGDNDTSRGLTAESLEVARAVSDRSAEASALAQLARVALRDHDLAAARRRGEESAAIWRELGDEFGLSGAVHVIAYASYVEGDDERARALFEESLELRRRLGDRDMVAGELTNLCSVETRAGNLDRAQELGEESLRIAREVGSSYLLPYCVANLGGLAVARGDAERGARLMGAAEAMFDAAGLAIDPGTAIELERHLERARRDLGDAFDATWSEGRAMPAERAIEYALGTTFR